MAFNRIIYLLLLAGSVTYLILAQSWLSWIILLLILILPLISLLLSIPSVIGRGSKPVITVPEYAEMGSDVKLGVRMSGSKIPLTPHAKIWCTVKTPYKRKTYRGADISDSYVSTINLPTDKPGYVSMTIRKIRIYDCLGLFSFPVRKPKIATMAVIPPKYEPEVMPVFERMQSQQYKPKAGGFSEVHENREYRSGDPVRSIHWKLSLKSDALIVREPQTPLTRRMVLALVTPSDASERLLFIGTLRYLSGMLLARDLSHEICYAGRDGFTVKSIASEDDLLRTLIDICLAAETGGQLPLPVPIQADWLYVIGRQDSREETS